MTFYLLFSLYFLGTVIFSFQVGVRKYLEIFLKYVVTKVALSFPMIKIMVV